MSDEVISLRVPAATKERLERLAESTKRSRSFLAAEALTEYLDRNEWQVAAIDEAVAKADEGVFVTHDAVSRWLEGWGSERETAAPGPDVFKKRA